MFFVAGPAYGDPFWDYSYGDVYGAIFSPYSYPEVAPFLPGSETLPGYQSGGAEVQAMCGSDSRDIAGWPIERLTRLLEPTTDQRALLDELANTSERAAQVIKAACTATAALTPVGRLAAMQMRLEAMLQAVDIVGMPLERFYDALNDEQKARLNGEQSQPRPRDAQALPARDCAAVNPVAQWPQAEIERAIQPTPEQAAKLDALKTAAAQAADMIAAACPAEMPMTPPARLDAIAKRLGALLDAVKLTQPPLNDFYSSLSDEQKARFNVIGQAGATPTAQR
jgi:hypothetical protein